MLIVDHHVKLSKVLLVINSVLTGNDNNFWNFARLCQIIKGSNWVKLVTIYFWGRAIGGGVRENNAYSFLLTMAHLLIFIHTVLYSLFLKTVFIFLVTKLSQKVTKLNCVTV